MTSPECQLLLDIQKARNEFDWLNFLVDIKYLVENKIELIGEPE